MELSDGANLKDATEKYIKISKKEDKLQVIPESEISKYLVQIVDAIANLHHYSIIHRDLRLKNVLLLNDETIKLVDFGLSRIIKIT
jgi:serine/threonine-protein kinase